MDEKIEKIDISDLVDELPTSRVVVAFERAAREFGHEPTEDEADSDEFLTLFGDELKNMVADDMITGLVEQGLIEATVREDGELVYTLTEKGQLEIE